MIYQIVSCVHTWFISVFNVHNLWSETYTLVVGDRTSDREQLLYVLVGLDSSYSSIVTSITSKKRVLSL